MQIFDISRALTNDLAPWPGDTRFHFALNWKMTEGASVNVGAATMGLHNGSHADAPFHFDPSGRTIEAMPLDTYLGPAFVADLSNLFPEGGHSSKTITVAELESFTALESVPRLLLKTGVWKDSQCFPEQIPVLAPEVPAWLGSRGVKLLGLDLPSVDPIESKELTNHHALAAAGVAIVESLDLSAIETGLYQFAALPLKISGGDAAPVRAVLWRE